MVIYNATEKQWHIFFSNSAMVVTVLMLKERPEEYIITCDKGESKIDLVLS